MSKERRTTLLKTIIVIAACAVVYIIVFHVPRPVMWSWETIADYEDAVTFINEDGAEETLQFGPGVIPVKRSDQIVMATISKDELEAIIKTTKCLRIIQSSPFYFEEYNVFTIDIVTDKGPMHIMAGEETALWYRDGGGFLKYSIIDKKLFYEHIAAAMQRLNAGKTDTGEILNCKNFLALLEANGFVLEDELPEENNWFSVSGKIIVVGGGPLYVYEYESGTAMEKDSKYVDSSGSSINNTDEGFGAQIDWVATPYWFKKDLIIVIYVGENEQMIDFLKETFGNVFAGG